MTEQRTNERIAEIKALCDEATPGDWTYRNGEHYAEVLQSNDYEHVSVAYVAVESDADFIAASRQIIPELLDVIRKLRIDNHLALAKLDEYRKLLSEND